MTTPTLKDRKGLPIAKEAIDGFASTLAGKAIGPGDADYEQARRIWNAHVQKHPGLIVRCAGTADVVQAVKFARANNVLMAVRGGGHNVAGRALCDDGIVVDLSGMKAVFVDPAKGTARVQGGATLGDVDRETHAFGRAVPVGVVSRTGIAGLTLGGGVGWLVRKYGLTCDNLVSCEVVTAEGGIVTASAGEIADLFWALRGGGGNFGIVTSFLYRTHPVSTVLGGAREVESAHERDHQQHPQELERHGGRAHEGETEGGGGVGRRGGRQRPRAHAGEEPEHPDEHGPRYDGPVHDLAARLADGLAHQLLREHDREHHDRHHPARVEQELDTEEEGVVEEQEHHAGRHEGHREIEDGVEEVTREDHGEAGGEQHDRRQRHEQH